MLYICNLIVGFTNRTPQKRLVAKQASFALYSLKNCIAIVINYNNCFNKVVV